MEVLLQKISADIQMLAGR